MSANPSSIPNDNTISVLLLRLQSMELLIPKAMIADVLSWSNDNFLKADAEEGWQLGQYEWQERALPLICLEKLIQTEHAEEGMLKRKVIVLKCVDNKNKGHHFALHCKGFPKPLILNQSSLDKLSQPVDDDWCAYTLLIGSRRLYIPDFHKIENLIYSDSKVMSQIA